MEYRYRCYEEMKDSGVEWIGKIPRDWEVSRIKNLIREKITDGPHETPNFITEGIPFLSVDGIKDGQLVFDNCRYISLEDHLIYIKKCKPQKNDILMGKAASTGKIAIVNKDREFSIWSPLALIKPLEITIKPRYLEYSLKSSQTQYEIDLLCTNNTQKNISMDDIVKIKVIHPLMKEQDKIVNFLNKKTSQFDLIISKKEALIQRLEEAKKSLISEIVTGKVKVVKTDDGYELVKRSSDEMKDSGVEWIGDIPKDWEIKKAKFIAEIFIPQRNKPEFNSIHQGTPWITTEDLGHEYVNIHDDTYFVNTDEQIKAGSKILAGDSVITTCVGTFGISSINKEPVIINQQLQAFTNLKINKNYLNYFLKLIDKYFDTIATETTIKYVNREKFENTKVTYPTKLEQQLIVDFLQLRLGEINSLISKTKNQIQKLKDAKQSLISEAVTGKIEILG